MSRFVTSGLVFLFCVPFFMGCGIKHRVEKNQIYFNSLSQEAQQSILRGDIQKGFTQQMVYLAWGNPTNSKSSSNKKGEIQTWIYTSRGDDYDTETVQIYDPRNYYYRSKTIQVKRPYLIMDKYVVFNEEKVIESGQPHFKFSSPLNTLFPSYCELFSITNSEGCKHVNQMLIPQLTGLCGRF